MVQAGYWFFATATLAAHAALAGLLILYFFRKRLASFRALYRQVQILAPVLVFLAAFAALLGSLFFSEIAGFPPCTLCWWQRMFIYPQVLLSYLSIMRDEAPVIRPYLIALSLGGLAVSTYHNFILWFPQFGAVLSCASKGGSSCIEGYEYYYGYITIPLMALTVLLWNLVLLFLFYRKPSQKT
ncbi:MAG: disulfide bond formation protein B [Patescibacteria group bacterium]|nr:disulfide bond formation protein B [Patescibacteria group bacterium]